MQNKLFRQKLYYTPQNGEWSTTTFVLHTLSYKSILNLNYFLENRKYSEYYIRLLEESLITIEDENNENIPIEWVPYKVLKEVGDFVVEESTISEKELTQLKTSLEIHFSKQMQADTWKCDVCRRKRLDKQRNCGFLPKEERQDVDFKLYVGNTLYTHCPIYDVNPSLLSTAIEAYNIGKNRFLPDTGGWYDQTQFFCIAYQLVADAVAKKQEEELKELKQKQR